MAAEKLLSRASMVLEMERVAARTPSVTVLPTNGKQGPSLAVVALAGALACTLIYVFSGGAKSAAHQLQFRIVSDVAFQEDNPRTAQLIVTYPNGVTETLTDNRYASAFIDHRTAHRFLIPNPPPNRLLFSPAPPDHIVAITDISVLDSVGQKTTTISLERLQPNQQVQIVTRKSDSLLIKTLPGTQVPTLELSMDTALDLSGAQRSVWHRITSVFMLFSAAAFLLLGILRSSTWLKLRLETSWARAAQFGAAAALILTMAAITKFNAHPDEYLHFEAAKYFTNHWFPPAFDDPAAEPSFSHYGVSYLQDLDIAYFCIGKLMAGIPSWFTGPEIAARLCNVLLFTILTTWLICRLPGSFAPAVLLISPQVWYVFSYVNGDAWALALSLIMMVQLSDKDSMLNEYLRSDDWHTACRGAILFAAMLALLAMAKRNYYVFLPFVGLVAFWQAFLWDAKTQPARVAKKWAVIAVAAATLYLPIRIGHEAINRFDSSHLRVEQAEKFAAPRFKPSEIAAGQGAQRLDLRRQGVPYIDVFGQHNWSTQSFQSFCGLYRWMSLTSPSEYYWVMGVFYGTLLAFLLACICCLSWHDALFAVAVLGIGIFTVLLSAYHSWTLDFQPQGRYLFPILPMIAFLFHRYRESLRSRVFNLLFGCLFACSVYSFVFVGLKNIPK